LHIIVIVPISIPISLSFATMHMRWALNLVKSNYRWLLSGAIIGMFTRLITENARTNGCRVVYNPCYLFLGWTHARAMRHAIHKHAIFI